MVEEALARIRRYPDEQLVGKDARAAGHGAAVAPGLANDGRGFAGDRRFVHRGSALDDLAVAGNQLAGDDEDQVALAQLRGVHVLEGAILAAALRDELLAGGAQRAGLRLAPALRDGFGEIGEDDGE